MTGRPLPDPETLVSRLREALQDHGVVLVERRPRGSGTFPKEIVLIRRSAGKTQAVFCKYSTPREEDFGHRGGIGYEARVYRDVLQPFRCGVPRFYGSGRDPDGTEWLVVEYLDGYRRLKHDWERIVDAAEWLGAFHAGLAPAVRDPALQFLRHYDEDYLGGWARRTRSFAAHRSSDLPWLHGLCDWFVDHAPAILADEPVVIHGEFTPKNVMVRDTVVCPTDWESAAVGAGEIDLACLLDGCDTELSAACTQAYADRRWPHGQPDGFMQRQRVAEMYIHFRWLGEDPRVLAGDGQSKRLLRLGALGACLGDPT